MKLPITGIISSLLMLITALCSCDNLDEFQEEVNSKFLLYKASQVKDLEGKWAGACTAAVVLGSQSNQITITYFIDSVTYVTTLYSGNSCDGSIMGIEIRTREFKVDGPYESNPSIMKKRKYTHYSIRDYVVFTHATSVTAANLNSAYGVNNWVINQAKHPYLVISRDGTNNLSTYYSWVQNGWDMWLRDYYEISGNQLTLYDSNISDPSSNQYPGLSGGTNYTRQ